MREQPFEALCLKLQHLKMVKGEIAASIASSNDRETTVTISPAHFSYPHCIDIIAISRFTDNATEFAKGIAEQAVDALYMLITKFKDEKPILQLNLPVEQQHWALILNALMIMCGHIYTHKLYDIEIAIPFAYALLRCLKPHIKSHHRILRRSYDQAHMELDISMAKHYLDADNLDLAEAYFNRAARDMNKCVKRHQAHYKPTAFILHSSLTALHIKRQDYLAAEAQYDFAMRYVADKTVFFSLDDLRAKNFQIPYFQLAIHYARTKQWTHQKRVLQKAIECYGLLTKTNIGSFSIVCDQLVLQTKICQKALNIGQFFHDLPPKIKNLISTSNVQAKTIVAADQNKYQRLYKALTDAGILNSTGSNKETLTIAVKITYATTMNTVFNVMMRSLFPTPRKQKKKPTKKGRAPNRNPTQVTSTDKPHPGETDGLLLTLSIFHSYKQTVKRQAPKKGKQTKRGNNSSQRQGHQSLAITQQRAIPEKVSWQDDTRGPIDYPNNKEEMVVIVMRSEFNCGKRNFAMLPRQMMLEKLQTQYQPKAAHDILNNMINTLNEAKQAGFFGRGVKSCPNHHIVKDTPYREELKSSKGYEHQYRVYGRKVHNGEYTLHIFDAIDLNPKSSASKLEILPQKKQEQTDDKFLTNQLC